MGEILQEPKENIALIDHFVKEHNNVKNDLAKIILILSSIAFVINLIWENAQAPLYAGYTSFGQHFWICLLGTLGDVAIILLLYSVPALLRKNTLWFKHAKILDYCVLIVLGGVVAILIEQWALSTGRWYYNQRMPIILLFKVGLLPFLQMLVLPPVIFYLLKKFWGKTELLKSS